MKLYNQGLLTLLISLFIFASCKISNTDLIVDSANEIKGTLVDTISLYSKTIEQKSAFTGGLDIYPLGFVKDSNFGSTEAVISASVTPSASRFTFGKDVVLDSAYLVLALSSNYYGDTTAQYAVEVRQLKNTLAQDANFKSDYVHAVNDQILGAYTGNIYPKTPLIILRKNTSGANDSTKIFPQIRIPLNLNLIKSLIIDADSVHLSSVTNFNNHFKGVQIKINKKQGLGDFGVYFVNFARSNAIYSGIELSYTYTNKSEARDTTQVLFPIAATFSDIASTVTRDYSESMTQNALTKDFSTSETGYIQPMAGTLLEMKSPNLEFLKRLGTVVINRAEFVLPISKGSDVAPYIPSPFLFIYTLDKADRPALLADGQLVPTRTAFITNPTLGGIYNNLRKDYVFNVTQHIQNIINNRIPAKNLYIGQSFPLIASSGSSPIVEGISNTFSSANTSIIASNKDGMKLRIFYTVVGGN